MNHNLTYKKYLWVTTLALLGSAGAFAADGHDDDHNSHSSHGAHVHGEAILTMALEGSDVEIMLESPAANIIGFEYKAKTEEEKRIEKQAGEKLKAANMFSFAGADCELEKVVVVLPGAEHSEHDEHHDDHSEKHDKHHDEHKDHHDEHDDDHGKKHDKHASHDEKSGDTHSEVTANYHYHCDKLDKLQQVSTELFKQFPKMEKIEAMWVSATGQGAEELSAKKSVMRIK